MVKKEVSFGCIDEWPKERAVSFGGEWQRYQIIVLSHSARRILGFLTHSYRKQTPISNDFNDNFNWIFVICVGRKISGPGTDNCDVLSTIIWQRWGVAKREGSFDCRDEWLRERSVSVA